MSELDYQIVNNFIPKRFGKTHPTAADIKRFIDKPSDINVISNGRNYDSKFYGQTFSVLGYTIISNYLKLTKVLIELGADVNYKPQKNSTYPLWIAVKKYMDGEIDARFIRVLLESGADPFIPNKDGSAFYHLFSTVNPELIELCLKAGKKIHGDKLNKIIEKDKDANGSNIYDLIEDGDLGHLFEEYPPNTKKVFQDLMKYGVVSDMNHSSVKSKMQTCIDIVPPFNKESCYNYDQTTISYDDWGSISDHDILMLPSEDPSQSKYWCFTRLEIYSWWRGAPDRIFPTGGGQQLTQKQKDLIMKFMNDKKFFTPTYQLIEEYGGSDEEYQEYEDEDEFN